MKTQIFSTLILFAILFGTSCKKEEEPQPVTLAPLSLSLSAEKKTISVGGDTHISASALPEAVGQ